MIKILPFLETPSPSDLSDFVRDMNRLDYPNCLTDYSDLAYEMYYDGLGK